MEIEIVIARFDEDISWIYPYLEHNIQITVYNKGEEFEEIDERIHLVKLQNIGREAHTYLYHIINNYENLANVTIFLQGKIDDHIEDDLYGYINKLYIDAFYVGLSKNFKKSELTHKQFKINEYCGNKLHEVGCNFGDFFTTHININYPTNFVMYINALFAVSKNLIKNRSKYYYKTLINLETTNNSELAHFIERSWYYIFNI